MGRRKVLEYLVIGPFVAGAVYLSSKTGNVQERIFYDAIDKDYDESSIATKNFDKCVHDAEKSIYRVASIFGDREPTFVTGFAHKRYIFTVNHAINPRGTDNEKYDRKGSGVVVGNEAIELEDFYFNEDDDVAIFKCPAFVYDQEDQARPFRLRTYLKLGDANKLNKGDFLFMVSGIDKPTYVDGKVSALEGDLILSSLQAYPGDSGTPLVALYDGTPQVVGITRGWREQEWLYAKRQGTDRVKQTFHTAIKINKFLERIK